MAWDKTHRHTLEDNRRRHIHWTRDGGKGGSHVCHNICARVVDQCLEKDTEKNRIGCFFLRFRCPRKKCVVGETVAGTTSLDVMRTILLDEIHQAKVAL